MEIDILKLLSNSSNLKRFSSLIREERFTKTTRFIYQNLEPYFNDTSKEIMGMSAGSDGMPLVASS